MGWIVYVNTNGQPPRYLVSDTNYPAEDWCFSFHRYKAEVMTDKAAQAAIALLRAKGYNPVKTQS
jgi:hypothetical protein